MCHLPPGTSKWNKIEHRLFAWISQNWRGQPRKGYAVILKLIAATTTEAGLTVQCQLDTNPYPAERKVSDEEMASLSLLPDAFHGDMKLADLMWDVGPYLRNSLLFDGLRIDFRLRSLAPPVQPQGPAAVSSVLSYSP